MTKLGKTFEKDPERDLESWTSLSKALQKPWQGHWNHGAKALKRRAKLAIEYPEPYTLNPEP